MHGIDQGLGGREEKPHREHGCRPLIGRSPWPIRGPSRAVTGQGSGRAIRQKRSRSLPSAGHGVGAAALSFLSSLSLARHWPGTHTGTTRNSASPATESFTSHFRRPSVPDVEICTSVIGGRGKSRRRELDPTAEREWHDGHSDGDSTGVHFGRQTTCGDGLAWPKLQKRYPTSLSVRNT